MALNLSKEVIMKMSKPDLENVCFERKLPVTGTTKELREQLLAEDLEGLTEADSKLQETALEDEFDRKSERITSTPQPMETMIHGRVGVKSDDSSMALFTSMDDEKARISGT